jgi:hypothetical protein
MLQEYWSIIGFIVQEKKPAPESGEAEPLRRVGP